MLVLRYNFYVWCQKLREDGKLIKELKQISVATQTTDAS